MNLKTFIKPLNLLALILAFSVILLGAYTRLTDAGLGCPDWPGCYGQFIAPSTTAEINTANTIFPHAPVDIGKARTEMTHRYFAEMLGGLIILFALFSYIKRKEISLPLWLPSLLIVLVLFQGMLGMWTVTMRLLPLVVVGHLMGGFCTLGLLWLCWLYLRAPAPQATLSTNLAALSVTTLIVLFIQILLGGWTSANYAALICPDFPTCQGKWWPAFTLDALHPLNDMDGIAKTMIHMMHRLGALITVFMGTFLSIQLWRHKLYVLSTALGGLLLLQVLLGISNIILHLPIEIAVAHNGVAACLLLTLIAVNFTLFLAPRAHHV